MDRSSQATEPNPERIQQMGFGYAAPLIVEAAIHHRVFDHLSDGAHSLEAMVAATGASARGLRAILNALVGLQLLRKRGDVYELTAESAEFLVSTKANFQGGIFRHVSRQLLPHWMQLSESVRTGQPATAVNREEIGGEFFQSFVEDLFPRSYAAAQQLSESVFISDEGFFRVLDLAAGSGVWSIPFAERAANVRVTAVDWSEVIPVTRRITEDRNVLEQYEFVEGDLLDVDFGAGYHVATVGHILHSEGEARSRRLLGKVFDALSPGGTVAIPEMVPDDDRTGPTHALIFAVNMLVHTEDGDAYTFAEISSWLTDAGFIEPRRLDVSAPSPLIVANKPT